MIIQGIVLDKEIVNGGMPTRITEAKITLINTALEISKTEFKVRDALRESVSQGSIYCSKTR